MKVLLQHRWYKNRKLWDVVVVHIGWWRGGESFRIMLSLFNVTLTFRFKRRGL